MEEEGRALIAKIMKKGRVSMTYNDTALGAALPGEQALDWVTDHQGKERPGGDAFSDALRAS